MLNLKRLLILGLAGLAFVFNLVNMSGLGSAYNTEFYTRLLTIMLSVVLMFRHNIRVYKVDRDLLLWGTMTVVVFFFSALLRGSISDAFNCLSCFFITYIFSEYGLDEWSFRWMGRMLLFGSFSLLLIFLKTNALSGWNENGIAMICFFAYICYIASVMYSARGRERLAAIGASIAFLYLVSETDARSSMLATLIALVVLLFPRKLGAFFATRRTRQILFHTALIFAAFIATMSLTSVYTDWDIWSYQTFGKPLMNGREVAWRQGFQQLWAHALFGRGNFKINSWHNWGMSLLTGYGVLGYVTWTTFVRRMLDKGQRHIRDPYILGIITSFLLILLQQSAELGLIGNANTHLLPYMMLGLLLGRVRILERRETRKLHAN